jgi:uncharacterized NAD(P)/FAD-binding protein YdhS
VSAIVIGGGFCGAMTAAQLAARGIATTVIEPGALGRGVAYAEGPTSLLLNTPSAAMSARPEAPTDFVDWLVARGTSTMFAPRTVYGDYVRDTIASLAGDRLEQVRATATAIEPGAHGYVVTTADGVRRSARAVVLALGNAKPVVPATIDAASPCFEGDPYRALAQIEVGDDPIALLGTGLTALDVIVSLRTRGHRGPIFAASRRGLVPLAHDLRAHERVSVPRELIRQPRLHTLLAWWRSRVTLYDLAPAALVTALRPVLSTIWQRLPARDRERFARHVRPYWDVIRHRAPPAIRAHVELGLADGSLEIAAARLVATERVGERLRCHFTGGVQRDVRWLVNCTGPSRDVRTHASPLVRSLLDRRMIEPDPLGLGVSTMASGQLFTSSGPTVGLYAVGPWRAADLWESTAVPELRVQAANTADAIAGELAPRSTLRGGSLHA